MSKTDLRPAPRISLSGVRGAMNEIVFFWIWTEGNSRKGVAREGEFAIVSDVPVVLSAALSR